MARESASLVLLDDNFISIVSAVRMGRRIFDNLKKAMAYIISVHVPIAGISLAPVLLNLPLVLLPVHIVFLELIIDPACSIVFESEQEEAGVMKRPPRTRDEGLFTPRTIAISLLQGGVVLCAVLIVYLLSLAAGIGEGGTRTLTFTTIVIANLGLILINRSWTETIWSTLRSPNKSLWVVFSGALLCLILVLTLPALQDLFHFAPVPLHLIAVCAVTGMISVLWFEFFKYGGRRGVLSISTSRIQ